jgi:hypothetical protein
VHPRRSSPKSTCMRWAGVSPSSSASAEGHCYTLCSHRFEHAGRHTGQLTLPMQQCWVGQQRGAAVLSRGPRMLLRHNIRSCASICNAGGDVHQHCALHAPARLRP